MGFGIAGLGAAVGGAAEGYMRGEKHRSEMEDAEARRGLVKLQTEKGQLELDEAKEQRALRDKSRSIVQRYLPLIGGEESPTEGAPAAVPVAPAAADAVPVPATTEAPAAATPAPAAAPVQAAAPATRPAGIATPSERVIATPASTPKMGRWDALQKMYNELNLAGLTANPQNWEKSLETAIGMGRKFADAKTDASIRALQSFNGENDQEVLQALSQAGISLPQGTKFEKVRSEAVPNSGMFFDDIRATSPDGKQSVTLGELMRKRLDAKEWMTVSNDLGYKAADLANKKQAEENLNEYRKGSLRVMEQNAKTDEMHKKGMLDHYKRVDMLNEQQRLLVAEQRKDLDTARAIKLRMDASNSAFDQIMQGFGVSKEMTPEQFAMLPAAAKEKYQNGLDMAVMAHAFWKMNLDPKGNAGLDTSDAIMLAKKARSIRPEEVYKNDQGEYVTKLGGREVRVPVIMAPQEQKPGGAAVTPPSGPAPAPTRQPIGANAPNRVSDSLPPEAQAAGGRLDQARAEVTAANAALRSFGLAQRRSDPQGFAQAQARAQAASTALAQAEQAYQSTLPRGISNPAR